MLLVSTVMGNPTASSGGASNGQVSTLFLYLGVNVINHSFMDTIWRRSALKGKLGQTKYCAL